MIMILILSLLLAATTLVTALDPDEETLAIFAKGPVEIHNWAHIGLSRINRRVKMNDPLEICCSTNYSMVWDVDDELIVLVMDNVICPKHVEFLRQDALGKNRRWETSQQALDRVMRTAGLPPGQDNLFYQGNFPGVTAWPVDYDSLMSLRRCAGAFMNLMMKSEMFAVKRSLLSPEVLEIPVFADDEVEKLKLNWRHVGENGEDEFEEDDFDEEDDMMVMDTVGNPLIPGLRDSFWASASIPAARLSRIHSTPHTDGQKAGLASVYTLTNDTKYEACGTSWNTAAFDGPSIVHNKETEGGNHVAAALAQVNALENGETPDSGWLNTTENRFTNVIALARNKFNRAVFYPQNRLHTAFIGNESLLNSDPSKGRLTMNTFWDVYEYADEYFCDNVDFSGRYGRRASNLNGSARVPHDFTRTLGACKTCKLWHGCAFCPYSKECIREEDGYCPKKFGTRRLGGKDFSFSPVGRHTKCENAVEYLDVCDKLTTCSGCVNQTGCAWCANRGMCTRNVKSGCQTVTEHFSKGYSVVSNQKCPPEVEKTNYDCRFHKICDRCVASKHCQWCSTGDPDDLGYSQCVGQYEGACGRGVEKKDIIGGVFGTGHCPVWKNKKEQNTTLASDEFISFYKDEDLGTDTSASSSSEL